MFTRRTATVAISAPEAESLPIAGSFAMRWRTDGPNATSSSYKTERRTMFSSVPSGPILRRDTKIDSESIIFSRYPIGSMYR
jgi:hypothetical protein